MLRKWLTTVSTELFTLITSTLTNLSDSHKRAEISALFFCLKITNINFHLFIKKTIFMATFNTNYEAKILSAGAYSTAALGNGISASTVHQVFCVSAGTISMTALGGGTFTWGATAGQSIDIILGSCTVSNGLFIGFKSQNQPGSQKPYYRY